MRRLCSCFAVKVQVSDQYAMTGLIVVLYVFILVCLWNANLKCEVAVELGDDSLNCIQKFKIKIEINLPRR